MNCEVFSYLYEKLLDMGALDIYTSSIYMKKNRPAVKLSVLCEIKDFDKIKKFIFKQTSTFGIRYIKYDREVLNRKFECIDTKYGKIRIKLGYLDGEIIKSTIEYEDCRKISNEFNIPLPTVYQELQMYLKNFIKI